LQEAAQVPCAVHFSPQQAVSLVHPVATGVQLHVTITLPTFAFVTIPFPPVTVHASPPWA
jgi:hypothetical protein